MHEILYIMLWKKLFLSYMHRWCRVSYSRHRPSLAFLINKYIYVLTISSTFMFRCWGLLQTFPFTTQFTFFSSILFFIRHFLFALFTLETTFLFRLFTVVIIYNYLLELYNKIYSIKRILVTHQQKINFLISYKNLNLYIQINQTPDRINCKPPKNPFNFLRSNLPDYCFLSVFLQTYRSDRILGGAFWKQKSTDQRISTTI